MNGEVMKIKLLLRDTRINNKGAHGDNKSEVVPLLAEGVRSTTATGCNGELKKVNPKACACHAIFVIDLRAGPSGREIDPGGQTA